MPKQEITIGGIAFTIIQTAESWVKCIASECIGNGVFDTKNRNDFAASDIREFLNGEFLQKLIGAGAPEAMFEYFNVDKVCAAMVAYFVLHFFVTSVLWNNQTAQPVRA